ncbi:MAG: glycosyl transferase [Rhodothalassiaceae bacterium]|nr:MAG: glycosyl transferase [Rhodothalassiaceae bacterium]
MTTQNPIRILFPLISNARWTGGYNYLKNLIHAISDFCYGELVPVVLYSKDLSDEELAPFEEMRGIEFVFSPLSYDRFTFHQGVSSIILGVDNKFNHIIKSNNVSIIFEHANFFGWRLPIPALAWLPDFQHRHLPHLFSRRAWLKRELGYRTQILFKRHIILSSYSALADYERWYGRDRTRVHVLRFAVRPPPRISEATVREVLSRYDIDQPFFYLPNQFWLHKNHDLVLETLAMLRRSGHERLVVATGNTTEKRSQSHYRTLIEKIDRYGLHNSFRILGMIPYPHVQCLMQCCAALINPSRCEGWSTTVEEARAIGTPMILSDLPVHREQAGGDAIYFDPASPEELAQALLRFRPLTATERERRRVAAETASWRRVEAFSRQFLAIVRGIIRMPRS